MIISPEVCFKQRMVEIRSTGEKTFYRYTKLEVVFDQFSCKMCTDFNTHVFQMCLHLDFDYIRAHTFICVCTDMTFLTRT